MISDRILFFYSFSWQIVMLQRHQTAKLKWPYPIIWFHPVHQSMAASLSILLLRMTHPNYQNPILRLEGRRPELQSWSFILQKRLPNCALISKKQKKESLRTFVAITQCLQGHSPGYLTGYHCLTNIGPEWNEQQHRFRDHSTRFGPAEKEKRMVKAFSHITSYY